MELRYNPNYVSGCLYYMQPGRKRREALKELLINDPFCKVHRDPDLKRLVKTGFLKKGRDRDRDIWGTSNVSYLYHPAEG
jgi:hypothetical protein